MNRVLIVHVFHDNKMNELCGFIAQRFIRAADSVMVISSLFTARVYAPVSDFSLPASFCLARSPDRRCLAEPVGHADAAQRACTRAGELAKKSCRDTVYRAGHDDRVGG